MMNINYFSRINQKIPRGPPSPPPPLMHSPSRKVTVKEQQDWKIPPCISNWKNPRGYTIPLDKRVAADGRGLQTVHINENFAKLAEALYTADRKAREAVELRAQIEKKVAQKEREKKEEQLQRIAQQARESRAGLRRFTGEDEEELDPDFNDREDLRRDRMRERIRERNLARSSGDANLKSQKDRDRDISEQIALGLPNPRVNTNGENEFDQRLFNQTRGLDSGFSGGKLLGFKDCLQVSTIYIIFMINLGELTLNLVLIFIVLVKRIMMHTVPTWMP